MKRLALVVDDVECHRLAVTSYLALKGFAAVMAKDGMEAFAALRENKFDIIVSDIEMPNMNGFELLLRIRRESQYNSIPVIMCSSLNNIVDIQRAKKLGANAYMVKPYSSKKFNDALAALGF